MTTSTATPDRVLPIGWLRAALAGVEAVVLTWLAVTAAAIAAYAATASAPQLGTATWTDAVGVANGAFFLGFGRAVGTLSLAPTLLPVLVALLTDGAARRLGGTGVRALAVTGAGAFGAALLIGFGAGLGLSAARPALLAGVAAAVGALAALGRAGRAVRGGPLARIPAWLRAGAADARRLLLALAALAFAACVLALSTGWHRVGRITGALTDSVVDTTAIWLAQAGYLPTALTWALGWLTGAGYSVGPAHFELGHPVTGLLPAVPALAAAPTTAWSHWVLAVVIAVSLGAGLVHGYRRPAPTVVHALLKSGAVAAVVLAALVLAAALTSGAIGGGVFARVGVWPLRMLVFGAVTVAIPYVLGVAAIHVETRHLIGRAARSALRRQDPKS